MNMTEGDKRLASDCQSRAANAHLEMVVALANGNVSMADYYMRKAADEASMARYFMNLGRD